MKAAVIGRPIAHSKSPIIHNYWLEKYGLAGSYEAIDILPDNLGDNIKKLVNANYNGFNVTVPYKQKILEVCDEIGKTAEEIGAVNTIIIRDNKLFGTNTDAFGFTENIKIAQPEFDFENKTAFVLGAGGAARAVIYGLKDRGIGRIKISNRTQGRAEELKSLEPEIIQIIQWDRRSEALSDTDLLVNTTSLGMTGKPPLEIDLSALPKEALVNDIVYAPLMTDLLIQAKAHGNKIVTGIGMLLHQARPAFEAWTGILPEVTAELEEKVLS